MKNHSNHSNHTDTNTDSDTHPSTHLGPKSRVQESVHTAMLVLQ